MKKVMLVDDEILIRENIRDCVDWEKEGFIYCGDASDGEVALPMIEQLMPDILITDIKMPFMNGLELCTIVRQRMPRTKIIILSGHDEFEYARSALRIGVEEYCLKPVTSTDIIQLLHTVSDKIDQERLELERIERLKKNESDQISLSQEKLLDDLCSGLITTTEAIHSASSLSFNLIARYYAVALSDIRCLENTTSIVADLVHKVENLLYEQLGELVSPLVYKRNRTEKVWIFKGDSKEQLQITLNQLQNEYKVTVENRMACTIAIGIGSIQDRLQGIHLSFLDAEEDKHWRRQSLLNSRAFSEAIGMSLDHSAFLDRNRFLEFLTLGSASQLESFLHPFTDKLQAVQWQSSLYGYYILNDLTLEVFRAAKEMYRSVEISEETLLKCQQRIGKIRSQEEACDYLAKLAEHFWLWRSGSSDRYAEMISQVKDYLHLNFDKDYLSLQEAAKHVRVSPSHLSKVFSQETGQTFMNYLTNTRIRKAMELLQSTNHKSYEIAHQVGYNDAHYFSNLFKKVTGMTTTEFRKQGQVSGESDTGEGE
ncbi:response regulator [Cohnella sp.]|uniref:response regulator n=1 Tax=Cohnella sp. TaxID=1883426 RepID=UPI00356B0CA3